MIRDWIIAHIFGHKCPTPPVRVQFMEDYQVGLRRGKTSAMAQQIAERLQDGEVVFGFDPKGPAPYPGTVIQDTRTEDAIQLKRLREEINSFADQLEEWARDNRVKRDGESGQPMRTLYGWMFTEQNNYATRLRRILEG